MSSTLVWRPVVPIDSHDLPFALKKTLSRRLWDTDGSCGHGEASMTADDIPYLEGLRDAHVEGADELIKIILKYGAIILWHEY